MNAPARRPPIGADKADRPTVGTQSLDPLVFLARLITRIPDPGQVMTRYFSCYTSRTRGMRRRRAAARAGAQRGIEVPVAIANRADWSLRAARYR